ncbi:MAG TPA: hypothetical protein VFF69_03330 [Phycisphaerales bacterium]|nr:hypothetical protein [Phycisphaerales bacterium]
MSDINYKPGEQIRCTITAVPRAQAKTDTIARLMRRDPTAVRALRRAQRMRRQRMHSYIRGGREWFDREHPAKVVRVAQGESWQMVFTPDILPDLQSVGSYVKIEKA